MKKKISQEHFRLFFFLMFLFYMAILIKIVLLRNVSLASLPEHFSAGYQDFRSLNLVPFQTFRTFASMMSSGNFLWAVSNIAGNALIFLPYGYLLSLLWKKKHAVPVILLSAAAISLVFEILQYRFYLGSADIDDVILNIIGAFLGVVCFRIISRIFSQRPSGIYKVSILLALFAFLGASAVGYFEFGNRLGLASYQEETVGGEKVPDRQPDYNGYFISGNHKKITVQNSVDDTYAQQTDFAIGKDTVIYFLKLSYGRLNPNHVTKTYKLCSASQLSSIKKHSMATIWYSKTSSGTADVIVLSDLDEDQSEGNISFGSDDPHMLTGYVSKTGDGQCTINKIDSYELKDGGSVSTSTKLYIPMKYKDDIPVTIRNVYGNGSSYKDQKGSIRDLKKDSFVTIEGTYKDQIFYGKKIIIQIFH
ncbi:VanZ family protein [Anaerostipes butyraticus]|uniref:VanZ family protein n=1 Tax=Anaerostipes butyraticus TaxID=645466 RepID=UPI003207A52B